MTLTQTVNSLAHDAASAASEIGSKALDLGSKAAEKSSDAASSVASSAGDLAHSITGKKAKRTKKKSRTSLYVLILGVAAGAVFFFVTKSKGRKAEVSDRVDSTYTDAGVPVTTAL